MHKVISGRIAYTSDQPERRGKSRGREHFSIFVHGDGKRTLQAFTEIDDPPNVLRLVTATVGADWQPLDAFVRLSLGDQTVGSTWYRFGKGFAECEGFTAKEGRIAQRFTLERPIHGFGMHPIQNDGWLCNAYDVSKGPGSMRLVMMVSSLDHRGATGPTLIPLEQDFRFLGREEITVRAGTFPALHFSLGAEGNWAADDPIKHPVYHLWTSADGEYLFLKGHVEGYMQTRYELVELDYS